MRISDWGSDVCSSDLAYREALTRGADLAERMTKQDDGAEAPGLRDPMEEVREFLRLRNNHFPELEERAEDLHARATLSRAELLHGLREHLQGHLGIGRAEEHTSALQALLRISFVGVW